MKYVIGLLLVLLMVVASLAEAPHSEWTTIRFDKNGQADIWQIHGESNGTEARIRFLLDGNLVGKIDWKRNGKIRFYGDIDQSARALMWRVSTHLSDCMHSCGEGQLRGKED